MKSYQQYDAFDELVEQDLDDSDPEVMDDDGGRFSKGKMLKFWNFSLKTVIFQFFRAFNLENLENIRQKRWFGNAFRLANFHGFGCFSQRFWLKIGENH